MSIPFFENEALRFDFNKLSRTSCLLFGLLALLVLARRKLFNSRASSLEIPPSGFPLRVDMSAPEERFIVRMRK